MRCAKIPHLDMLLGIAALALLGSCASVNTKVTAVDSYQRLGRQVAVAVLDVANRTKYGARNLSDSAAEILTSELLRSGDFVVIERQRLDEILKEMQIQLSDLSDSGTAVQVGKLLNCKYLLTGTISNFGVKTEGVDLVVSKKKKQTVKVEVDIRMINVESAQVVYSAYGRGEATKTVSSSLGIGGTGGYDETLAGECMRGALGNAVQALIGFLAANPAS